MSSVLIIDDNPDVHTAIRLLLKPHIDQVICSDQPGDIPSLMNEHQPDAILLDMNFGPGESSGQQGLLWLERILTEDPHAVVVMITAHAGVNTAVDAMKKGATDFIVKPWQNEKLLATMNAALKIRASQREADQLRESRKTVVESMVPAHQPILGTSTAMARVMTMVERAAPTDANVLILGENGTGKELVAKEIHRLSDRRDEVFISVDLGAVAESVFESELFGHKRGAFTDARSDRIGRLAAATGGTLFLDEVGNLPLHLQAKLLTVLEQRQVTPVGSNQSVAIDVRVISATNLSPDQLNNEQHFRQDLLFRLNTVQIDLPALRQRRDDIPILIEHYLRQYERKYKKAEKQLPVDVMQALIDSDWPGNVRALRHSVERAVILSSSDRYQAQDFSLPGLEGSQEVTYTVTEDEPDLNLDRLEKQAVQQALKQHSYNISKAAKALGLTRAALYRRIRKHDL